MKKVLIVKLAAIGDVIITCQAFRLFLKTNPQFLQWEYHWIIDQALLGLASELLKYSPEQSPKVFFHGIESKDLFSNDSFLKKTFKKISATLHLISMASQIKAGQCLVFHRDSRYFWLFRAFSRKVFILKNQTQEEAFNHFSLFENLSEQTLSKAIMSAAKPKKAIQKLGILLGGGKNQKTNFVEKTWPYFEDLCRLFLQKTGIELYLFGSQEDAVENRVLLSSLKDEARVKNYVGKVALKELPGVFSTLDAFLSVDSGLAHLAAFVFDDAKSIYTIFGPTNAKVWKPVSFNGAHVEVCSLHVSCAPCYHDDGNFLPCPWSDSEHRKCMKLMTAQQIFDKMTQE